MQSPRAGESWRTVLYLAALVAFAGCGGVREQFIGTRVQELCDGQWPVCGTTVGCFIGDRTYVEGRFPGKNSVAIHLFEPSKVTVSFFPFQTAGEGEQTVINLFEDECRARVRLEITGRTFLGEAGKNGFVERSAQLSGIGDHLIDFESDARTKYLAKIDVVPTRLVDLASQ